MSSSNDPTAYSDYGPFLPGYVTVEYDNLESLEAELKDPNTAAFMVEPIQGEVSINNTIRHLQITNFLKSFYLGC